MRAPSSVGVDDDLPAGEAGVALRAADDELAGGIDMQVRVITEECKGGLPVLEDDLPQGLLHHLLHDQLVHLVHRGRRGVGARVALDLLLARGLQGLRMLRGDHHCVDLPRLHGAVRSLQVLDRHLRLAIRPQPPEQAALAHVGQCLAQARRDGMREGHAILGLVAGVPEHDTLVAGADIQVLLADMHAACDVGALLVDAHQYLARLVAEALAVDAREVVLVRVKSNFRDDAAHHLLVVHLRLCCDLAGKHHHVVLGHCLASHLALRIRRQARIEDGVGDLIADLVGVALVDGLRREQEHALGLGLLLRRLSHDL
mmetsp:Transcript_30132/g.86786  ORF Transcript_30132/g.86786 Transcript_30132/m.86786 type:complete len:315 (-) Transcript_30132:61-1005(-)